MNKTTRMDTKTKLFRAGLESLIKARVSGKKRDLTNALELTGAVIDETEARKKRIIRLLTPKTLSDYSAALSGLETVFKEHGAEGLRQFTDRWTKADFYAVLKEAFSTYSNK